MIAIFDGHNSVRQGASGTLDGVSVTENHLVSTVINPILHLSMIQHGNPAVHISTQSLEAYDSSAKNGQTIKRKGVLANALGADLALDIHLNASKDTTVGGIWLCHDNLATERARDFCHYVVNRLDPRLWPERKVYQLEEDRDGFAEQFQFAEQCGETECDGLVVEIEFITNEPAIRDLLGKRYAKLDNLAVTILDAYEANYGSAE